MGETEGAHQRLVERVAADPGVVVLLGGPDSGKSTLAQRLLDAAWRAGWGPVHVDTDLGQAKVGPPTTLGLRVVADRADLDGARPADLLYFVGDVTPRGRLLALLTGTARLVAHARARSPFVVVDTPGFVLGAGLSLQLHALEVVQPEYVIGLQRHEELAPLLSSAARVTSARVHALPVHPLARRIGSAERARRRRDALSAWFLPPLRRVGVSAQQFLPPLSPDVPLDRLDGILAGVELADGRTALGVLKAGDQVREGGDELAVALPERFDGAVRGVRLGSARLSADRSTNSVELRELLR